MTHGILLFIGHPTYMKSNQNKDINYKVVDNKLEYVENILKVCRK
jgi:hypothetical protein